MGPHGNRGAPVTAKVAYGEAELRPDPARPRGWTLLVDGVPQSYVDLDDPAYLEFSYMRRLGRVVRSWTPGRVRPEVLHLGGGALTLPRLLEHLRPGVSQRVVERDPALLALVSRVLPFAVSIEVEVGDARAALERQEPAVYDLIVADVFDGAATPVSVASIGFARAAARALRAGGLYAMNVTDVPPLAWTRVQVATLRAAFGEVVLLAEPAVVRARRAGNVILLAGNVPMTESGKHERVLRGADLADFAGGAKPRLDAPG
jgi:spermidine synthase